MHVVNSKLLQGSAVGKNLGTSLLVVIGVFRSIDPLEEVVGRDTVGSHGHLRMSVVNSRLREGKRICKDRSPFCFQVSVAPLWRRCTVEVAPATGLEPANKGRRRKGIVSRELAECLGIVQDCLAPNLAYSALVLVLVLVVKSKSRGAFEKTPRLQSVCRHSELGVGVSYGKPLECPRVSEDCFPHLLINFLPLLLLLLRRGPLFLAVFNAGDRDLDGIIDSGGGGFLQKDLP